MAVTIRDIAKQANVSTSTVSLALNNKSVVKEETRERVLAIARELGYSPNANAQGLARKRTRTIGLVVPDIENAYYGKLIRHTDEYVDEAGYRLILATSGDKQEAEKRIVRGFVAQRVEGIIIAPVNKALSTSNYPKQQDMGGIPCVYATSYYPGACAPYVMTDLEEGTYRLVSYLLETGHSRIAFLTGSPLLVSSQTRISGYARAHRDKGRAMDEDNLIECKLLNYEQGYETTASLIAADRRFGAIVAINDAMALGAINALRDCGVRVPADVSVAGFDNMLFSTISRIPITTVHQDLMQISRHAVDMIIEQIERGPIGNRAVLIKPELILRASTAAKQ